jgi:hypothetical protein
MRQIKTVSILLILFLLSACDVFLGPEPDTSPGAVLYSLWNDFDKMHAYLDLRMSDNEYSSWHDVYYNETNGYRKQLQDLHPVDDGKLFWLCTRMLEELDDAHVSLRAPNYKWSSFGMGGGSLTRANIEGLDNGDSEQYTNFLYGTFPSDLYSEPQIGYIHIVSFSRTGSELGDVQDWAEKINDIVKSLSHTGAIIIDVRYNGGGNSWAMEYIADRFSDKAKSYIKERAKNGPGHNDFSPPQTHFVKPAETRYTKPIVLLTNNWSVSAAEWFTLALRTQDHVTHAGTTTHGAFSARVERLMINGWIYNISPYLVTDMDDKCYEGVGIDPEIEIDERDDVQLETAANLAHELAKSAQ